MGKIITTLISDFSGGLSNDQRAGWTGSNGFFTTNKYALTKHFDTTFPKRLRPHYKTEAFEDAHGQATKSPIIVKFLYYNSVLYGFGVESGSTNPRVWKLGATHWDLAGGTDHSEKLTRNEDVFFEYKGLIYMWATSRYLVAYNVAATTMDDNVYDATSFTTVCQPVLHPSDDIAYFFHDNFVHRKNGAAAFEDKVLSLPASYAIKCACPYGNYLALGCTTTSDPRYSVVFLWDRDSSLTTLTERINFGEGAIVHLANLDNRLIAVMDFYNSNSNSLNRAKILVKTPNGQSAWQLNELETDDDTVSVMPAARYQADNKLYFPLAATYQGEARRGIWVVDSAGRLTLELQEEEVESAATKTYQGIYRLVNQWWIAHSADGSVNCTDTDKAYSTSLASTYESLIFDAGDSDLRKKLIGVTVMTEQPLSSIGRIVLKYVLDGDISGTSLAPLSGKYTTIFDNTAETAISHSAVNIESSGLALPEYRQTKFLIESYGGAVITGFKFKSELLDKSLY